MTNRRLIGSVALLALLILASAGARAEGEGKYPDWSGQWFRTGGIQFDPTKPLGRGQQAPLTSEYQAMPLAFELRPLTSHYCLKLDDLRLQCLDLRLKNGSARRARGWGPH
jgi:hypothetical protein